MQTQTHSIKRHLVRAYLLPLAAICALIVTLPSVASDTTQIEQSLKVSEGGLLRFKMIEGNIQFKGWDKDEVMIKGSLGHTNNELEFYNDGDETVIKIETDRRNYTSFNNSHGIKLDIYMPASKRLLAQSTSGDFEIQGLTGGIKVKNVSGDIAIADSEGAVRAYSSSGDITLKNTDGDIHVESISGDVEAQGQITRFEVSTISGDLEAVLKGVTNQVEVDSVSGDIELTLNLDPKGSFRSSTVSGDVDLLFDQSKVSAHFDLSTGPGGNIDNNLTQDKPQETWVKAEMVEFKIGSGSALVNIETVSGQISVAKK